MFGVPSVLLIDFSKRIPPHLQHLQPGQEPDVDPRYAQWWHTPDDTLDKMSPDALAFAGNLVVAVQRRGQAGRGTGARPAGRVGLGLGEAGKENDGGRREEIAHSH